MTYARYLINDARTHPSSPQSSRDGERCMRYYIMWYMAINMFILMYSDSYIFAQYNCLTLLPTTHQNVTDENDYLKHTFKLLDLVQVDCVFE